MRRGMDATSQPAAAASALRRPTSQPHTPAIGGRWATDNETEKACNRSAASSGGNLALASERGGLLSKKWSHAAQHGVNALHSFEEVQRLAYRSELSAFVLCIDLGNSPPCCVSMDASSCPFGSSGDVGFSEMTQEGWSFSLLEKAIIVGAGRTECCRDKPQGSSNARPDSALWVGMFFACVSFAGCSSDFRSGAASG